MDGSSEHEARLLVRGGRRLQGAVSLAGAKNSALKLLAASLLTDEPCTMRRVPRITDVATMVDMLRALGADVDDAGDVLRVRRGHRPERMRSLRAGAHHARQHHRHGTAGGAPRRGHHRHAGGLQHRAAAHRLPHPRPGEARGDRRDRPRVHQGPAARSSGGQRSRSTTRAWAPPRTSSWPQRRPRA